MSFKSYHYKDKQVYVISENDLNVVKQHGRELRITCPIHNSRDADASVHGYSEDMTEEQAALAGWGQCFGSSCNAVILVREWNPKSVYWVTGSRYVPTEKPEKQLDLVKIELREEWQLYELQALEKLYPTMQQRITHPRAIAYLTQRYNVPTDQILDMARALGLGYIPPIEEWTTPPQQMCRKLFKNAKQDYSWVLNKWCDRLVFPFTTPDDKRGFSGRTLALWTPGMDENQHKAVLNEHEQVCLASGKYNQYRRYEKTYRNGIINTAAFKDNRLIRMTESGFDMIPWLLEGYDNTIAVSGNDFAASFIPASVRHITIAFDSDIKQPKLEKLMEKLGGEGFTSDITLPLVDEYGKDWCERYRRIGLAGLATTIEERIALLEWVDFCFACLGEKDSPDSVVTPAHYEFDGVMYCAKHYPGNPIEPDTPARSENYVKPVVKREEVSK